MRRWITSVVLSLVALSVSLFASAQTINGQVRSPGPLAGATVQAELDGHAQPSTTTGDDGRFSVTLSGAKPNSDLRLSFAKSGFHQENRVLSVINASAKALDIVLQPLSGSGSVTDAEKVLWDPHRTASGIGPLMFVPYALSGGAAAQAAEINTRLGFQLQRLIGTRLQAVLPDDREAQVVLKPVSFGIATDLERLRTFGEYVNALGVVSGLGVSDSSAAGDTFELSSIFLIIPRSSQFDPPQLWINDVPVPAASIGRASLDAKLSKDWGRAVIVALATRDLKNADSMPAEERSDALKRIRRYLIAERADVGGNEGQSAVALQQVLALVNKEVTP